MLRGDVPAMKDAVMMFALVAEARSGIGAHRNGRDLERGPVDRPPELAPAIGFQDVKAVDLVADRDRADVPSLAEPNDKIDQPC